MKTEEAQMTVLDKRIVLPVLILCVAAALTALLMANKKAPEKKPEKNTAPFVAVERVELKPLTLRISSQGVVTPQYETQLLAQVSGEILEVSPAFVRGGLVKKGDLLAQIDPFNYQVKVQQATATLANARATFILERAQGQVAAAEWEKITTAEPSDLGLRKPQQEQALAAVKAAQAALKQARKDLERTKIVAPYDALISARQVSPGTFVNMGAAIGRVMDVRTAEVRLPVTGNDFLFLQNKGLNAPVTLSTQISGRKLDWQAKIVRDEGVVDDENRMLFLVAQLEDPYMLESDNQQQRLPFGTYVTAEIAGKTLESAAYVPRKVLRGSRIPIYQAGKLSFAKVDVIRHEGKNSVITGGLKDGDLMITSSLQFPVEGMDLALESEGESDQPTSTTKPEVAAGDAGNQGS